MLIYFFIYSHMFSLCMKIAGISNNSLPSFEVVQLTKGVAFFSESLQQIFFSVLTQLHRLWLTLFSLRKVQKFQ